MLNLSEQEVVLTTDDLVGVNFSQAVDGKGVVSLFFKGDPNEYNNPLLPVFQSTISRNAIEPDDANRFVITEEAFIFPTGTFKIATKAKVGNTGTYSRATRSMNYDGAVVKLNFDTLDQFNSFKDGIQQCTFWSRFVVSFVSENLVWKYVGYKKI